MATSPAVELIAVSLEDRRALRDLRTQLGLSRATVEQRARVGTDYMKHLESGQYPRLEASRLRRVVQVLQQAAARRQVSAQLTSRFARVVKAVGQPEKSAATFRVFDGTRYVNAPIGVGASPAERGYAVTARMCRRV